MEVYVEVAVRGYETIGGREHSKTAGFLFGFCRAAITSSENIGTTAQFSFGVSQVPKGAPETSRPQSPYVGHGSLTVGTKGCLVISLPHEGARD